MSPAPHTTSSSYLHLFCGRNHISNIASRKLIWKLMLELQLPIQKLRNSQLTYLWIDFKGIVNLLVRFKLKRFICHTFLTSPEHFTYLVDSLNHCATDTPTPPLEWESLQTNLMPFDIGVSTKLF